MVSGLNLVVGYLGELSLGHSAYFGIGAYTSALISLKLGMSVWVGLALSGMISGLFGFLIGYPSLRLKGPYFAIVTLGFAMILKLVALNWMNLTNGPLGIAQIPAPEIFIPRLVQYSLNSKIAYYYLILIFVFGLLFAVHRIIDSPVGKSFIAYRENEELAQSVGVNTFWFKLLAFIMGSILIGMSGSFYAHYVGFIDPEIFSWYYIVTPLNMLIIGGAGTIVGPVIGAFLFTLLPEYLRVASVHQMTIYGIILIVGIIFMPSGIYGFLKQIWTERIRGNQHASS
jgi:branched-chain amino acid transport system permease protein